MGTTRPQLSRIANEEVSTASPSLQEKSIPRYRRKRALSPSNTIAPIEAEWGALFSIRIRNKEHDPDYEYGAVEQGDAAR